MDIAKRTSAQCVAIVELAGELGDKGVENVADPNLGGTVEFDGGWVRLVPAWHTSTTPDGTVNTPAGLVINLGGKTVYHLGDTALFSDLALPGKRDPIDVALVVHRRPLHDGPPRRGDRGRTWSGRSRSSRATTTRSRRSRPTRRRSSPTSGV